ncbi:MAG: ImmA/IrrE family metallo-endopeptidase [Burkholderiales bacterium]|nr:MAG: ImmA/IrrE family metallo-endopeptidase [Burkholderiales bacterium]
MSIVTNTPESASPLQVIKNDSQYLRYLEEAKVLISLAPNSGTISSDRLELLTVLLEKYEEGRYLLSAIDPIDAIGMRMAELGLEQKDLARILNSASRASEVINRKRPLTLDQIRILHRELKIPAHILLDRATVDTEFSEADYKKLPLDIMVKRGWFGNQVDTANDSLLKFKEFLARVSLDANPVFMRRSIYGMADRENQITVYAWLARVVLKARETKNLSGKFTFNSFDLDFLKQVAKLSAANNGPLLAQQFLAMKGISLVIEPELPGMKLDGAVLRDDDGTPIIGMTIRRDYLDNFWFTLMHELVHLLKHFGAQTVAFVDDISYIDATDTREFEADAIAAECLIPKMIWNRSNAPRTKRKSDIDELANQLCISPSIVAGRIRKETDNWSILTKLLGIGEVRKQFPDVIWK